MRLPPLLPVTTFAMAIAIAGVAAVIPDVTYTTLSERRDMNPYSIGPGIGGEVWFADLTFRQVGIIHPDGTVTKIRLTSEIDPANEMRPITIVGLADGTAAATVYETNGSGSPLNRTFLALITREGDVRYTPFPSGAAGACRTLFGGPDCGIAVDPSGDVVYVAATSADKVLAFPLAGGQVRELNLPGAGFLLDISPGPTSDTIGVTDIIRGSVHEINTRTEAVKEILLPGPNAAPSDIALGPEGYLVTDSSNQRLLNIRGPNDIDVIDLGAFDSRVPSVATGDDDKAYVAAYDAGKILQVDLMTRTVNESTVPGGDRPAEIINVPCPPDKPETMCMVFNSQPPASFDNNVRRAEIKIKPSDLRGKLTLTKSFRQARVRRFDEVIVDFVITNVSDADITGKFEVIDVLPPGLERVSRLQEQCTFDIDGRLIAHSGGGRDTIPSGKTLEFSCRVQVVDEGRIDNQAELFVDFIARTGVVSNTATVVGESTRSVGSPPPPPAQPKILPPLPKN